MRRFAVPAVITAVAVVLLIVLAVGISSGGPNNSIAYSVASQHYRQAPKYDDALPVLTGGSDRRVSFASLRGKLVLVNFFASWCDPCKAEAPVLERAEKLLAAHDGTVLGIVFQNDPGEARGFVSQYGLSYPTVTDPAGNVAAAFGGLTGVPDSYLINREGKIVWLNLYQLTSSFTSQTLPQLIAKWA